MSEIFLRRPNITRYFALLLILVISLCYAACDQAQKLPGIDVPIGEMNQVIRISAPEVNSSTSVSGIPLSLDITNIADDLVVFPHDYGMRIFVYQDEQWTPVRNNFLYSSEEKRVSPQEQLPLRSVFTFAMPDILTDQPVLVRFVIVGTVSRDGILTDKQVGAYVDVTLQP